MYKYRLIALSITFIVVAGLPMLSLGATLNEQTLKSEVAVGSYTNMTFVSQTVNSNSGHVSSRLNQSGYVNVSITSINSNTFNVVQYLWFFNGSHANKQNFTLHFNSTDSAIFNYINTSNSYVNQLNFTPSQSNGTYKYDDTTYPMIKIIASGGYESLGHGLFWFSNQTMEYDPYSGIIFSQEVNTAVVTGSNVTNLNGTYTLIATNVYMGPSAGISNMQYYEEVGIIVSVLAVAVVAASLFRRKK